MRKALLTSILFASCVQKKDTTSTMTQLTNLKKAKIDSISWAKRKQDSFEKLEFKKISLIELDTFHPIDLNTIQPVADSLPTDTVVKDPYFDSSFNYMILRKQLEQDIDDIQLSIDSLERIK